MKQSTKENLKAAVSRLWKKSGSWLTGEYASSILLVLSTLAAIWLANGRLAGFYEAQLSQEVMIRVGAIKISEPLRHWSNQILMSIFFLFVGLEIKEEFVRGNLSTPRKAFLPVAGALGGLIIPAGIFMALNWTSPHIVGWAVPTATDPAFAIAILTALKRRIPVGVRALLLTLATVDDIGATVIIAFAYAEGIRVSLLLVSAAVVVILIAFNKSGIKTLLPYLIMGGILWVAFVGTGVHTSVAAVLFAFTIPIRASRETVHSPLMVLKDRLSPWVHFLILPIFALLNAGVALSNVSLWSRSSWAAAGGVFLGLVLGKPLGIVGGAYLARLLGVADLPGGIRWGHIVGIGFLGGIGFTTSLFLANLAFGSSDLFNYVQLSILSASTLMAMTGAGLLYWQSDG